MIATRTKSPSTHRRFNVRRSGLVVALCAGSALMLSACGSSGPSLTTTTTSKSAGTSTTTATSSAAHKVVTTSEAAMLANSSVHYTVDVDNPKTKSTYSIDADLGTKSGEQTLLTATATAGVRITPTAAYISGNAAGLADFFGMPTKDISKVGTKWVVIASGSSQYTSLADSNTLGPIATTLYPTAKTAVTLATGTYKGQKANILSWTQTSSTTTSKLKLYVSMSTNLPLYALGTGTDVTQKITFSKWNETVNVVTPTNTIPFATVSGS